MSLQSRIQVKAVDTAGEGEGLRVASDAGSVASDPFAEVKTRVHAAVIARVGPRLFNADGKSDADLEAAVGEAVTEALAVEKMPLTRGERAEIIGQITDDILGFG